MDNQSGFSNEAAHAPVQYSEQVSVAKVVIGAIVAALVGAVVWALIVYYGEVELGIIASGIGALVGIVVAFLAKSNITQVHQVISVIFGVLGVLAGKYIAFYLFKQDINEQLELLGMTDLISGSELAIKFSDMFEAIDILWIALAVAAAWTLPRRFVERS